MSLLWAYPAPLTTTVAVVLVGTSVGLLSLGVFRDETRFHPSAPVARSALWVLAFIALAAAAMGLLLAMA